MKIKFLFLFVLVLIFFPICGCKPDPVALITAVKADNTADAMKLIGKGADANVRTTPNGWRRFIMRPGTAMWRRYGVF